MESQTKLHGIELVILQHYWTLLMPYQGILRDLVGECDKRQPYCELLAHGPDILLLDEPTAGSRCY